MENKKINIAELLKDSPKGTKLYSPLCGECRVIKVYNYLGFDVINGNDDVFSFSYDGRYNLMGECCIFPSKDQRDWSKFIPPCEFKDGDVLVHTQNERFIMSIYKSNENEKLINTHVIFWDREEGLSVGMQICCYTDNVRFATKEEKQKLFDAIKDNGYKWHEETKTLEKLPKFKVGDKIAKKGGIRAPVLIAGVGDTYYWSNTENSVAVLPIAEQDDWELIPDKFDITTLKPFESKVLVRHNKDNKWCGSFFSHIDGNLHSHCYKYVTVAGKSYPMCIPYEGNEHLLSKTEDCEEYFKTWEI